MKKTNLLSLARVYLTAILICGLFSACNPSKDSSRKGVNTRTNLNVTSVFGTGLACAQGESNIGTIYDQNGGFATASQMSFEDRVKALLSASVDPKDVGTVSAAASDQTGVRFQGVIKLDANGQVNLKSSKLKILVYDSYVLQSAYGTNGQKYEPIPIEINSAASGQFDQTTGVGSVLFTDEYGEIRLDGKIDAQYFSGTVSFKNLKSVLGGTLPQGQLGQFYVARCGIIQ